MDVISYIKAKEALIKAQTALDNAQAALDNTLNGAINYSIQLNTKPFNFVDSGGYLFEPPESTENQASYASVIRMDNKVENPLDKFYMYWAGHDGGGIRLSTAPDPSGPWAFYPDIDTPLINDTFFDTQMGGVSGHISSPCIVFDELTNKFYLYFHRLYGSPARQSTWRAESVDGLTFSNPIEVIPCPLNGTWDGVERTYFRVIRYKGKWVGVYQGRNSGSDQHAHIGYAESSDGVNWNRLSHPLWYDNQFQNFTDSFNLVGFLGGSPCLLELQGTLWCFFVSGQSVRNIYAAPIESLNQREVTPMKIMEIPSWALSGGLESPNFLSYNNKLYMFFHDYDNTDLRRRIGVAVMDLEVSLNG
ncbi:hypothetical protein [Bacillus sp. 03113]|uniref:hypothetical protein n=1 Tax=Bacillus sp. 03113 TaxID=2578211 RepID=UPI0015E87D52|nr:hypothetical protein [Bacillus sp. 03113]